MKRISILIPVYNEEENIFPLYTALKPILETLNISYQIELLFTDNCSNDNTFAKLEELTKIASSNNINIKVLRFSRNFGFQKSIHTAYINSTGDAAVQIDCDLQDPPELILSFVKKWEEGYAVVYGIRKTRKEGFFITSLRKVFYFIIDQLSEDKLPRDAGDFRLVDKAVIEELKKIEDQNPYLRGSIATMGFKQIGIEYDRAARQRGESKFPLKELIKLALDGILNHSILPLRMATYIGLIVSFITFIGIFVYSFRRLFFHHEWPAGFTTTTVLLLLSISLNALFLGIIGEYLGRIYHQVKKRPITIIEKKIN